MLVSCNCQRQLSARSGHSNRYENAGKFNLEITADEVIALGLDFATDPTVPHKLTEAAAGTLTATTTPPVTKVFSDSVQLSGGVGALDLTALAGPNGTTIDFTGLKVQLVALRCATGNAAGITVDSKDAVTGYNLFGIDNAATAEKIEVLPGDAWGKKSVDTLENVDATHKDITLAGTDSDTIQVLLVAG